jgi:hypothetical protein
MREQMVRDMARRTAAWGALGVATLALASGAEGLLGRWERMRQRRKDAGHAPVQETTPQTLRPGDALMLWNGDDRIVQTTLALAEHLNNRETDWRWLLLDGDTVLEVLSGGETVYYDRWEIVQQGSVDFVRLVGDQDGLLRVFEARVRDGSSALNPTVFEYDGGQWQLLATGTFVVRDAAGGALGEVWRDVTPNEGDNVYAKFVGSGGEKALAVWTTHIGFLRGRDLGPSDLRCYGQ